MKKTDYNNIVASGYPFVDHVPDKIVQGTFNFNAIYDPRGYHSNQSDLIRHGYIKVMGYIYTFPKLLNKYVVKCDYEISEFYAPNKTMLRNLLDYATYGKIHYIIEIEKC